MSNPQEKAEELVLKYLKLQEPNYNWFHKGLAKQCALAALEFIIEQNNVWIMQTEKGNNNYWNEVKKEIELL